MVIGTFSLGILVAYLIGSIPTAVWLSRLRGVDIRTVGSGNAGATNMVRAFGWKMGLLTFLIDALKGYVAVAWVRWVDVDFLQMIWGAAAVLGHIFPIWAGFRGGKGVATFVGVMWAVHPLTAAVTTAAVVAVIALTRYVSLGSIVGSIVFAAAYTFWGADPMARQVVWVFPLIILWSHRSNIGRLWRGTERKLGQRTPLNRTDADT